MAEPLRIVRRLAELYPEHSFTRLKRAVLEGQVTLLGEPALHLNATLLGTDAEINSRLWDIAPDGSATLVTRGAYRWTVSTDAASITYALLGSGWRFAARHQLRIQVTQNDMPYLRLDNYQSSAVYSSMQLTLPTTASIGC